MFIKSDDGKELVNLDKCDSIVLDSYWRRIYANKNSTESILIGSYDTLTDAETAFKRLESAIHDVHIM